MVFGCFYSASPIIGIEVIPGSNNNYVMPYHRNNALSTDGEMALICR
jgi:hypothetical protein